MLIKNRITSKGVKASVNEELAQELHKQVIKNMQKKGVRYFLCVIDIFIKHAWVKPLKDKKAKKAFNPKKTWSQFDSS